MKRIIVVDQKEYDQIKNLGIAFRDVGTCSEVLHLINETIEEDTWECGGISRATAKLEDLFKRACQEP